MNRLPYLHVMPRVKSDMKRCLHFVSRLPWGKPDERLLDILSGIERALLWPASNPAAVWRPLTGIELRRCKAAQFAIIYAYLPSTALHPRGVVSIRAIRHSRVSDVFAGVKEP